MNCCGSCARGHACEGKKRRGKRRGNPALAADLADVRRRARRAAAKYLRLARGAGRGRQALSKVRSLERTLASLRKNPTARFPKGVRRALQRKIVQERLRYAAMGLLGALGSKTLWTHRAFPDRPDWMDEQLNRYQQAAFRLRLERGLARLHTPIGKRRNPLTRSEVKRARALVRKRLRLWGKGPIDLASAFGHLNMVGVFAADANDSARGFRAADRFGKRAWRRYERVAYTKRRNPLGPLVSGAATGLGFALGASVAKAWNGGRRKRRRRR